MTEIEAEWQKYKDLIYKAKTNKDLLKELYEESEKFLKLADNATITAAKVSEKKVKSFLTFQTGILVLNTVIIILLFAVSTFKIGRPLTRLTAKIEELAKGDLTVSFDDRGKDECGIIARNLNSMVHRLNEMIVQVLKGINEVIASSSEIRKRAQEAADGAKEQSLQAVQIAAAAEEMSQTITDIAKHAQESAKASEEARKVADEGKQIADKAISAIERVNLMTNDLSSLIEKLSHRVKEIGDIVAIITEIADQTKLLALNAAIEAARAGEHGRGFAVVADEVKNLAERTTKATAEIREKISTIQADSEETVKSMTETTKEIGSATQHIRELGDSLERIWAGSLRVNEMMQEIANVVSQQSLAANEIANSIEKITSIAKKMENLTADVLNEMDKLAEVSDVLRSSATAFKPKLAPHELIELAKTDHRIFLARLHEAVTGKIKLDPNTIADHRSCRLGRWYFGEGMNLCGNLPSFRQLDHPHERFHQLAKEIVNAYNQGDHKRAYELYKSAEEISQTIIQLLDAMKSECQASR